MSERITYDNVPKGGSGQKPWLGFHEVGIMSIIDNSKAITFAKTYIKVELYQEGQKYPPSIDIFGDFEYDDSGDLKPNWLIRDFLFLFHVLDLDWGWTPRGDLEDAEGNKICHEADGIEVLLSNYLPDVKFPDNPAKKYYVYIWDKFNKKAKRAYSQVYPHIVLNNAKDRAALEEEVASSNERGYLVNWDGVTGLDGGSNVNISSGAGEVI